MAKNQKQSILTMDVADLFQKSAAPKAKPARKGLIDMSKQTMNFARHEPTFHTRNVLMVVLAVALVMGSFLKFGILDPINRRAEAYEQLAQRQEQYAQAQQKLEGYEDVAEQYRRYSYGLMTENEVNLVNRMDVLALVEREIAPYGRIQNFAVNNNVLTLNIYGITLEKASTMVARLEQNPLVTQAAINSASADDGMEARIFISVNLAKAGEVE